VEFILSPVVTPPLGKIIGVVETKSEGNAVRNKIHNSQSCDVWGCLAHFFEFLYGILVFAKIYKFC